MQVKPTFVHTKAAEVEKCNESKDVKKREEAPLKAEANFKFWTDIYPELEPWQERLKIQKSHDEVMDKMGLYQKEKQLLENNGEE